jgi:23S rRNA pseudouridine2605 synthase
MEKRQDSRPAKRPTRTPGKTPAGRQVKSTAGSQDREPAGRQVRTATRGKAQPETRGRAPERSQGKTPAERQDREHSERQEKRHTGTHGRAPERLQGKTPVERQDRSSSVRQVRTATRGKAEPGTRGRAPERSQGKAPAGRPVKTQARTPGKRSASPKPGMTGTEPVRLNRYIANSGLCARREADELIKKGHISVNGVKVTDMGIRVKPSDSVEYNGRKLRLEKKVYILLNKPKGYVTTVKDPHAEATVIDLVRDAAGERIYPVGRLDKSTTGVLLLTNDGELAGKLTHPRYGARKVYLVVTDRDVTRHDMETIIKGVDLDDGTVSADAISYFDPEDRTQVGLEIHSGQNRVVRRIFEKLGYRVKKLDRVSFAGLTKKNLPRGTWRHLTSKELSMLKRGIFK